MIKNKWNEEIEVQGRGTRKGTVMVRIFNECTELYEVCRQSVKEKCGIKNRKTRSIYGIGYLDFDKNTKTYKYNPKEYSKWNTLIRKYARTGIECEKFCSYVEFLKELRNHPLYNDIINSDGIVIVCTEDGQIKVNRKRSFSKDMVVKINTRTRKATVYDNLEQVANDTGFTIDYLRKIVNTDILVKGCRLEWLDD